jgi:hypothetical protein
MMCAEDEYSLCGDKRDIFDYERTFLKEYSSQPHGKQAI